MPTNVRVDILSDAVALEKEWVILEYRTAKDNKGVVLADRFGALD